MQDDASFWELKASPLHHRASEQINAIRFSASEELLWSVTERGFLYANVIPELDRYCSFGAHHHPGADVIPLPPSIGDGVLSLSAETVQYHSNGGCPRFSYSNTLESSLTACAVDTQTPQFAIIGRDTGEISTMDIHTGRLMDTVETLTSGVEMIKSPTPKGLIALGSSSGEVVLADPKRNFKAEQSLRAHTSRVVAMDTSGSMLATAGLGTRQGQLVHDTIVKVYDLRSTARVLHTIPFHQGPSMLRFHPRYQGTLLIAAASGAFIMDHIQSASYAQLLQVDTEGDLLTTMDISSSGECVAFGGSGGFVHLWAFSGEPRANLRSAALDMPSLAPQPATSMEEDEAFSISAQAYYTEERPLSDWDPRLTGRPCLPPRLIDASLLKDTKQVDFVTYIPNPFYQRDKPLGEAAKKVALLRNKRLKPKQTAHGLALNVDGPGASHLPERYRRFHITLDVDRRYEEFDFSRYNKTRFAGLENGIANCYANALVQVLYFIPQLRAYFLSTVPDANLEFSLLDELALCFRMLASESGHACQATNLLKALRQSREATGLGLLEGHAQKGARAADIEVEANKDQSLARRIQRLQRFLLDKLHHESLQRQAQHTSQPEASEAVQDTTAASTAEADALDQSEGASSKQGPEPTSGRISAIDAVFGMKMKQTMQGLQGTKPVLDKDIQCFQVDLQYPRKAKAAPAGSKSPGPDSTQEADRGTGPSFANVLSASLRAEGETRAWFNDQLKYQYVRQTRQPLGFPQVLTVGTNLQDPDNRSWWQPNAGTQTLPAGPTAKAWAPWALAAELVEGEVRMLEADAVELMPAADDNCTARAEYQLTAVVALVQEELNSSPQEQGKAPQEAEGHLVAHVQVPLSYLDKEVGTLPTPRAKPPSPGYSARKWSQQALPFARAASVSERPFEGLPEDPFGDSAVEEALERAGAAAEHGLPDDPFGDTSPHLNEVPGRINSSANQPEGTVWQDPEAENSQGQKLDNDISPIDVTASASGNTAEGFPEAAAAIQEIDQELPKQFENLKVSARRSDSLSRAESAAAKLTAEPTWLLINDFSICQAPRAEALQLFQGHKFPCLLYYTQVSALQWGSRQDFKAVPKPVLASKGQQAFHTQCRQPPLQAALVGLHRLGKPTFWPLTQEEGPHPGLMLGLDAEFVAFSPPSKAMRGGVEIETAPSRLGLARVSVVRGEGPQAGKACIDDHIRATEPVYDYLTQYSGLRSGDLDPAISQHHLTTLKASYLKLRFLVDAGCVFVGHGLKKDFRMINMLVPPEQVVDTVDLFYMKKQRKISLRFLAAYLLNQTIQQTTHDSIEDACTALSLYKLYAKLRREGRVREVVEGMYAWRKQHSWDASALGEHPAA